MIPFVAFMLVVLLQLFVTFVLAVLLQMLTLLKSAHELINSYRVPSCNLRAAQKQLNKFRQAEPAVNVSLKASVGRNLSRVARSIMILV